MHNTLHSWKTAFASLALGGLMLGTSFAADKPATEPAKAQAPKAEAAKPEIPKAEPDKKIEVAPAGDAFDPLKPAEAAVPVEPTKLAVPQEKIVEKFLAHIRDKKDITDEVRKSATSAVETSNKEEYSRTMAITTGLLAMYPNFAQGLAAFANEELPQAALLLEPLSASADPFLAAEASLFLARVRSLQEQHELAMPLLNKVIDKGAEFTPLAREALFLKGTMQAYLLDREAAISTLRRFLAENPTAPERLRIGAMQQIEQLKLLKEGSIGDVERYMRYSRRKLAIEASGKETQEKQEKIIAMLDKLIKEAEDKEQQGKGSGSGQGSGKGGPSKGQKGGGGKGQPGVKTGGKSGDTPPGTDKEGRQFQGDVSEFGKTRETGEGNSDLYRTVKREYQKKYEKLVDEYFRKTLEGARP